MFGQFHDDPVSDKWLYRSLQPTAIRQLRKNSFNTQKTALQKESNVRNYLCTSDGGVCLKSSVRDRIPESISRTMRKLTYSKNGGERDNLSDSEQLQKLCKTVTK